MVGELCGTAVPRRWRCVERLADSAARCAARQRSAQRIRWTGSLLLLVFAGCCSFLFNCRVAAAT